MKRYAPATSVFRQARERVADVKKQRERLDRVYEQRKNEMKALTLTEGGKGLLDSWEGEFQSVLFGWLQGDPTNLAFSVKAHAELNQILRWRRRIEPEEDRSNESPV